MASFDLTALPNLLTCDRCGQSIPVPVRMTNMISVTDTTTSQQTLWFDLDVQMDLLKQRVSEHERCVVS